MKKPLVSIIIPAYNAAKHIAETIQSAINQTWTNKEIIVIDDGSTDETLKIIKSFDNQALKVFQQANKGAAATRNKGLSEAKGEFIQFLDADDILSADKIEKQVLAIYHLTDALALCSTIHFEDQQVHTSFSPSPYEEDFLKTSDEPVKFLIKLWGGFDGKGSMIQPNAWLIPRTLIDKAGNWNVNLTLDDDGEFFTRIILNSTKIVKVSNVFNYYRKYKKEGNLSSQKTYKNLSSLLASILSKKQELLSKEDSLAARFAIYRLLYDVAIRSYPQFKDISKKAIHELPLITPLTYKLDFGRKVLSKLASVLGWKSIRLIQYSYQNLANRIR